MPDTTKADTSKPDVTRPSLTLKRHLKAPVERVFRAWTEGEALKRWFGPSDAMAVVTAEVDLKVGGRYRIVMQEAGVEPHRVGGVYREIVPNRRLVFTWAWESTPERESLVTVELAPEDGGTRLTLTHERFFDEAARDGHGKGWTGSLARLDRHLGGDAAAVAVMKLYGFPQSPNTWKVLALASHIGVPLRLELVDLTKGAQRQPEYLALSPSGRTPTLVDGDFVLWESTAILQYIASRLPTALWPADDRKRADIMRWQSWQLQHWSQACEPFLFERIVKPFFNLGAPDPAVIARAEAVFEKEAGLLDRHLAARRWLVGEGVTLAEYSVAPYLVHAEGCGMPLARYPNIVRWFGEVSGLPSWRQHLRPA